MTNYMSIRMIIMDDRIAVTLDVLELYREMQIKMDWEEGFGENLSALWDILTAALSGRWFYDYLSAQI